MQVAVKRYPGVKLATKLLDMLPINFFLIFVKIDKKKKFSLHQNFATGQAPILPPTAHQKEKKIKDWHIGITS